MVWILLPTNPSLGSLKYYFTSSGTYKVGRKDCAIIIQTDKTVSRLHAEIKIEHVDSGNFSQEIASIPKSRIVLRDLSKFGSFVNKTVGSKPVFSLPEKAIVLKEEDLITFGTDNCTFRLEYLSLVLHAVPLADKTRRDSLVDATASVGGYNLENWCTECTHLIVEDGSIVTNSVIQAVAERKPVIGTGWIEALAGRSSPSSDFPSISRFIPNMLWKTDDDAKSLKIAEPEVRLMAFKGLTFYVGPIYMYTYKELLHRLVEASGGVIVSVADGRKCKVSQESIHQRNEFLIVPSLEPKLQRWMTSENLQSILHVPQTSEEKIVAAVLAGQIDSGSFQIPTSSVVSNSSEETVDAAYSEDRDDEIVSSSPVLGQGRKKASKTRASTQENSRLSNHKSVVDNNVRMKTSMMQNDMGSLVTSHIEANRAAKPSLLSNEKFKDIRKQSDMNHSGKKVQSMKQVKVDGDPISTMENTEFSKADVHYCKDLIVCERMDMPKADSSADHSVPNFKHFRKNHGVSGNSFIALVPFAKEPYRESDYAKEVQEYMQQEKIRKQAESLAEDLFNAEKLKRQKGTAAEGAVRFGASLSQQKRPGTLKSR